MENIESQVRVINKTADIQVWWFISIYILLQFLFTSFLYFARDNFAPAYALLLALFDIIITWVPLLLIPVVVRYGFKKVFSKKNAIIYTVIFSIILFFGNVVIDLYFKSLDPNSSTTTIWNLIMMVIPYYILSNSLIFSFGKKKDTNKIIVDT